MSLFSMKPLNFGSVKPPIAFAAKNPQFVSTFPDSSDQLWTVDIKASRHSVQCDVYAGVLFVESNGIAFVYGIEFDDGYPQGLNAELAEKQQKFIQFLRGETRQDNDTLGLTAIISNAHEYSSEGKATAAYIAVRDESLMMGIGYRNDEGKYELIAIDPANDSWLELARSTLPFDELGHQVEER